jgi:hypothetical protein
VADVSRDGLHRYANSNRAQPTAWSSNTGTCTDLFGNANVYDAQNAVGEAESSPYNVSASLLGFALHPYSYTTADAGYWRNYSTSYSGAGYGGVCKDLAGAITLWRSYDSTMPVFFTEDNWNDQPNTITSCTNQSACEGTYLVDLFTWLADHNSYANSSSSAVRLAWFTGVDFPGKPLGLYSTYGADKNFNTAYCPNWSSVAGTHSVANAFYWLDWNTACYSRFCGRQRLICLV